MLLLLMYQTLRFIKSYCLFNSNSKHYFKFNI